MLPSPVRMRLVGVTFCDAYPEVAHKLARSLERNKPIPKVRLVREPNNPHDSNAVLAQLGKTPIGHIDRFMAKRLAREMDRGAEWRAEVAEIVYHPDSPDQPAIWLGLERVD